MLDKESWCPNCKVPMLNIIYGGRWAYLGYRCVDCGREYKAGYSKPTLWAKIKTWFREMIC